MVKILMTGGIVAIPLLGFSLLAVALIIERVYFWSQIQLRQNRLVDDVLKLYRSNPPGAIALLKKNADLPMARIFLEALCLEGATPTEFRLALESATQAELPLLKRFNTLFQTIITVSPLLGLLGTILGLMRSFSSMSLGNTTAANASGVTGGISEALVSTVMGLVVAIATLLFANVFRSLYLRQFALIQEQTGQIELVYRRFHDQPEEKEYATSR